MTWLRVILLSSLLLGCVAEQSPTSSSVESSSLDTAQSSHSMVSSNSSIAVSSSSLAPMPMPTQQDITEGSDSLCSFSGILESTHAGFEGADYINVDNQNGATLQW